MADHPKITVLMPVYNGEAHLREAIESILLQTFDDFEILIINDGSQDNSQSIIESYNDNRIRLLINSRNKGLTYTLNRGIENARGQYIARMDCDDICFHNRLEEQVRFMDSHPDVIMCGTGAEIINSKEEVYNPEDWNEIKSWLFFRCCFIHPTVMFRGDFFKAHHILYDSNAAAEDYELWVRLASNYKMANIHDKLLYYRYHEHQVTHTNAENLEFSADNIRRVQLQLLNIIPNAQEWKLHKKLCNWVYPACHGKRTLPDPSEVNLFIVWMDRLVQKNREYQYYPASFESIIFECNSSLNNRREELIKLRLDKRKICIWGTGARSVEDLETLRQYNIDIYGFIDNSPTKWGKLHLGYNIFNPSIIEERADGKPFVIISSMYYKEIGQQLKQMGYQDGLDYIERLTF